MVRQKCSGIRRSYLVQACMQDKKANFKKKADSEWDKIKKDL